jgi:hypothetical protein
LKQLRRKNDAKREGVSGRKGGGRRGAERTREGEEGGCKPDMALL